jgi:hypothetical protein
VTGTTVGLSVLGSDDAGEAGLTYTWKAVGTPPAPVAFTANGTNAAKSTTATFRKAGDYRFEVTVRDAAGQTATSTVDVTVSPTFSALGVSPGTANLPAGATLPLAATARDQFGEPMAQPAGLTWSVSGLGALGSVSASGLYTAPAISGANVLVRANAAGLSAAVAITVSPPATPTPPPSVSTGVSYVNGFTATGLALNGYATVRNGRLRLTDGGLQRASSFTQAPVNVRRFTTQFSVRLANPSGEGLAFVLQGVGPTALGQGGSGLGYAGIGRSVAVLFDVNGNAGVGPNSVGLMTNGGKPFGPALDLTTAGLDLRSGHEFRVTVVYDNSTLTVLVTDAKTGVSAALKAGLDLATVVGGSAAYAGFTAASGGLGATHEVIDWTFTTVPAGSPRLRLK